VGGRKRKIRRGVGVSLAPASPISLTDKAYGERSSEMPVCVIAVFRQRSGVSRLKSGLKRWPP